MRRALLAVIPLIACATVPRSALAQGEYAVPMPRGTFRLSIGGQWAHATDRFGIANPTNPTLPDGTLEPLGVNFSADSLGVSQLPFLTSMQDSIRSLTGLGAYSLNLGRSHLTLSASVRHQPIRLFWAPSSKLVFGVSVPFVRARMSAFLLGPDTTGGDSATIGNVGLSSEFLAAGAMDPFRTQTDAALAALAQVATSGPAALRAQAAAELAALRPVLCGLSTLATRSGADQASPCYAAGIAPPSGLLPVETSAAGDSITVRYGRAQTSYEATRTAFAAQGATLPPLTASYDLPSNALDSLGVRRYYSDPNGVLAGDSLTEVVRTGIGDIEVGGWFQLAASARWRSQLQLMVRLPTGTVDDPDNFIDIGTGDHQTDVELALRNDLMLSQHFWMHVGGKYGVQMADQLERRVTPWYLPLAAASGRSLMKRDLGDYFAVDLVPNWQLDDAIGVGLGWHYFHQGATSWSYADPTEEARVGMPAEVLGLATDVSRMRVGVGVTYNTLPRYATRRARLPYRVTWSYNATLWGAGGQVPKSGVMTLEIQAFFGGHLR